MSMYNPPHPGELLKEDILPGLKLTVSEAANKLGVARGSLSRVINGRAAITAEMALKLEAVFTNPPAESWLKMQVSYDLWQARQKTAA